MNKEAEQEVLKIAAQYSKQTAEQIQAIKGMQARMRAAQSAVEALQAEHFLATEYGWGNAERDSYHATHWNMLVKAVEARRFCSDCGEHYNSTHDCTF